MQTAQIDNTNTAQQTKKRAPVLTINDFVVEPVYMQPQPIVIQTESEILDKVFIPNWNNKPEEREAVITLNNTAILTHQNTTAIIAAPGVGKTSICEAAAASFINKYADCLGIEVNSSCSGLIWIDNERTNLDVWNSYNRMCKRANIPYKQTVDNVTLAGLRSVPRLAERLKAIEHLLNNNPCGILILDGAGDLVTDTNDLLQAVDCRIFLREMTVKYNLSILTTLHPNPGSFKPRGHIGSEIHREAECVLVAKNYEGDTRIITSVFEHGKNRNNAPITGGYVWSENEHMFISAEIEDIANGRHVAKDQAKRKEVERIAISVMPTSSSLSYTDTIKGIMTVLNKSKSSAKRLLEDMEGWSIINKGIDGNYRLNTI